MFFCLTFRFQGAKIMYVGISNAYFKLHKFGKTLALSSILLFVQKNSKGWAAVARWT